MIQKCKESIFNKINLYGIIIKISEKCKRNFSNHTLLLIKHTEIHTSRLFFHTPRYEVIWTTTPGFDTRRSQAYLSQMNRHARCRHQNSWERTYRSENVWNNTGILRTRDPYPRILVSTSGMHTLFHTFDNKRSETQNDVAVCIKRGFEAKFIWFNVYVTITNKKVRYSLLYIRRYVAKSIN